MAAVLDPRLLELLVDPEDKQPLLFFADKGVLYNERLKRVYAVNDNIAVLLVDDARTVDEAEHKAFIADRDSAVTTGSK